MQARRPNPIEEFEAIKKDDDTVLTSTQDDALSHYAKKRDVDARYYLALFFPVAYLLVVALVLLLYASGKEFSNTNITEIIITLQATIGSAALLVLAFYFPKSPE